VNEANFGMTWIPLLLLLGISFFCVGFLALFSEQGRNQLKWQTMCWVGAVLLALIVTSPLYYEFPDRDSIFVISEDGNINKLPDGSGVFCWERWSDKCFRGPGSVQVQSSVAVVTPNPKVRNIHITVSAEITNPSLFFSGNRRQLTGWMNCGKQNYFPINTDFQERQNRQKSCADVEIGRILSYHMYDFLNDMSKDLSAFSNPLDSNQQSQVGLLVKKYLNPRLAQTGLLVNSVAFSL
jgi:hypothetical protein